MAISAKSFRPLSYSASGTARVYLAFSRLARTVSTVPASRYCLMSFSMVSIQLPRNTSRSLPVASDL
ncbi:hypothetical protein D9M73_200940 [compost metagenome]